MTDTVQPHLPEGVLQAMADDAFVVLNWARRQGMGKAEQMMEVVKAFEVRLGYREAELAPAEAEGALQPGATGKQVEELQASLAALGWSIPVTGVIDDETTKTIQAFQHAFALCPHGVATPKTREKIAEALCRNRTDH